MQAFKRGLMYPQYAWITFDWYPHQWWKNTVDGVDCTDDQLEQFLDRVLSLRRYPLAGTDVDEQFEKRFRMRDTTNFDVVYAGLAYDALWAAALALNTVSQIVESQNNKTVTGCEDEPGSLAPLELFDYGNKKMGCLIQWSFQRTNFSGVTVYPIVVQ